MNPFNRSVILVAEHQLEKSKHEARDRYRRVQSALRSRLGRPLSLLVVAGVGALIGVWFARRNKTRRTPDGIAASPPLADLVSAFFIRFGMRRLAAWTRLS